MNNLKKSLLPACFLLFSIGKADAQEIKLQMKKGQVLFDKEHVLDYTFDMVMAESRVFKKGTKDELISVRWSSNGTKDYKADDYTTVYFSGLDQKIESKTLYFGFKGEGILKILVNDGILSADGSLDQKKVEEFCRKYGMNILRVD